MTIERLRFAIPAVLVLILLAIGFWGEKRPPAIAADSMDIFADFEALRTYVREYGPGRTMAQLSQLSSEYAIVIRPRIKREGSRTRSMAKPPSGNAARNAIPDAITERPRRTSRTTGPRISSGT